jgi:hypothetical protein
MMLVFDDGFATALKQRDKFRPHGSNVQDCRAGRHAIVMPLMSMQRTPEAQLPN